MYLAAPKHYLFEFLYLNCKLYFHNDCVFCLYFAILRVFAILQNTFLLKLCEGKLFLSHVVAQKKTRSHFRPMIYVID